MTDTEETEMKRETLNGVERWREIEKGDKEGRK